MAYIKKTNILICGLGFIGLNLTNFLLKKGFKVIAISRKKNLLKKNLTVININPYNKTKLIQKFAKIQIDYVVNTFGKIDHSNFNTKNEIKIFQQHFIVTKNLADLAITKNASKFIQIGSADEYGNVQTTLDENTKERPTTPYGLYKLFSTNYLSSLHDEKLLNTIVLRLFTSYGLNQSNDRFLPFVINQSKMGKSYKLTKCDQYRDFVHIEDLTTIIYKVIINKRNLKNIILNVGTSEKILLKDIVLFISKYIGSGSPKFGALKYSSNNYNKSLVAKNDKLIRYIGKFKFKNLFKEIPNLIDLK